MVVTAGSFWVGVGFLVVLVFLGFYALIARDDVQQEQRTGHATWARKCQTDLMQWLQDVEKARLGAEGRRAKELSDVYAEVLECQAFTARAATAVREMYEALVEGERVRRGEISDMTPALGRIESKLEDPSTLLLVHALFEALQIPVPAGVRPLPLVESPAALTLEPSSSTGPLAPHPVPNIGRQLKMDKFSEETLTNGMRELMEGAAQRGITLSPSEARHQAMLALNGVES